MALLVAGCSALAPDPIPDRYFDVLLPAAGEVPALPLRVSDTTGSITGVALDPRVPATGAIDETFLAAVPGRPDAIVVGWPGGTCDEQAALDLSPGARGPTITLKLVAGRGGCFVDLAPRRVIVSFGAAVDVTRFTLDLVQ